MHQSLYRKYRPSNFNEVVGQNIIVKTLKNAVKNNLLSHAYLFTGPRGTGKTSIAKILAKTVNCDNLIDNSPCNKCVNCTQSINKQSIDIIEIDAASNNGVEEIRELKNKIGLVPSIGKYKVYIIDEVHMLSIGAFNALLKTLEEPPKHVIFILATTDPQKIPSTILSRCQRFDFKKIDEKSMYDRLNKIALEENIIIEEGALKLICQISDGGMRDALSLLDQAVSFCDNNIKKEDIEELSGIISNLEIKEFIENIINNKITETFEFIDNIYIKGKDFYKVTEEIILYLRNILVDNKDVMNDLNINSNEIISIIKIFNNCLYEMKTAFNIKLIFELAILSIINNENALVENKDNVIKKDDIDIVNITKIKDIRIGNTLCNFNKKEFLEFKNKIYLLEEYLLDEKYSKYVSLILDGVIKAYSQNYFIIIFKNKSSVDEYNLNYKKIDELFYKVFSKKIKGIAVMEIEWEKIKEEFNNKTKIYKYIEE